MYTLLKAADMGCCVTDKQAGFLHKVGEGGGRGVLGFHHQEVLL